MLQGVVERRLGYVKLACFRGLLHRLVSEVRPLGHVRCVWVYLMGLGGLREALLHLLFCPGACHV